MPIVSVFNIKRTSFLEIKQIIEQAIEQSEADATWRNWEEDGRKNILLLTISVELQWKDIAKFLDSLQTQKAKIVEMNHDQDVEIGVNSDTIQIVEMTEKDKDILIKGLNEIYLSKQPTQEIAVEQNREIQENPQSHEQQESNEFFHLNGSSTSKFYKLAEINQGVLLKFDNDKQQALALEGILNFIDIESFSFSKIFQIDLREPMTLKDLNEAVERIQSKIVIEEQVNQQNESKLNEKRKAEDKNTEEISEEFEPPRRKQRFGQNIEGQDMVTIILTIILLITIAISIKTGRIRLGRI